MKQLYLILLSSLSFSAFASQSATSLVVQVKNPSACEDKVFVQPSDAIPISELYRGAYFTKKYGKPFIGEIVEIGEKTADIAQDGSVALLKKGNPFYEIQMTIKNNNNGNVVDYNIDYSDAKSQYKLKKNTVTIPTKNDLIVSKCVKSMEEDVMHFYIMRIK